ncbi:MAG TPA: hemolysin family protein [Pyrinomonadaceae bacterium]|jgi:CBS domain containing-hemolysin-like protein|nr:hemolysin family protein [Pyrinomonadaceae bacterium]
MDDPASSSLFLLATDATGSTADPSTWLVILLKFLLVLLLVFANGFFVAAEFAFVAVRRSRIESLVNDGHSGAKRLIRILNNLNAYLSASQLGITLASLALGWVGEPFVAQVFAQPLEMLPETARHAAAFLIAFALISSLHIVLGEQAPKLIGLEMAERVALGVSLPMKIFYQVFKLPIHALDWASAKVVRLFGLKSTAEQASIYTEEEIRQLVRISEESGHLNKEERRLINRVFEFSDTTVKEAMIPRTQIAAIPVMSTLEEIAESFQHYGYSRLPVYRESLDDIAGLVHSKDLLPYLTQPKNFALEKVLHKPLYVVDTAKLEEVLRQMQKAKSHFGFVVDEHGGVEGIITLEDLLEEIVGEISDEHDEEVKEQIREQKDGSYALDGGVAVRDLNRKLDLNLPVSEAYTTVAGFLMAEAGQVLKEGDKVPFNGHVFQIDKVDKRRILKVTMKKTVKEEQSPTEA